jgi:hypothetical protein
MESLMGVVSTTSTVVFLAVSKEDQKKQNMENGTHVILLVAKIASLLPEHVPSHEAGGIDPEN